MKLDGSPLPWSEIHTADGKPIRPQDLPGHINFLLYDRLKIDLVVTLTIRGVTKEGFNFDPPELDLRISEYEGLSEITNSERALFKDEQVFINTDGPISDEIVCDRAAPGTFPQCADRFDYRGVDVQLSYARPLLLKWRSLRALVTSFLGCTYKSETLKNPGGSWTWD